MNEAAAKRFKRDVHRVLLNREAEEERKGLGVGYMTLGDIHEALGHGERDAVRYALMALQQAGLITVHQPTGSVPFYRARRTTTQETPLLDANTIPKPAAAKAPNRAAEDAIYARREALARALEGSEYESAGEVVERAEAFTAFLLGKRSEATITRRQLSIVEKGLEDAEPTVAHAPEVLAAVRAALATLEEIRLSE